MSDASQLAQELELERARLAVAQRLARLGSWETDLATLRVSWSEETHRIFETDSETFEPTHQAFLERIHPLDRERVDAAFVRSVQLHTPCAIEHRVMLPGGRTKFVEERWQVSRDDRGVARRAFGTCQDITDRELADEALRQSQGLLRIAGRVARLGGWMIELPERTLTWSDETCAIHDFPAGYRPTLDEGLSLFPAEYRELVSRHLRACETEGVPYDLEVQKLTATGRLIWVRSIGQAVRDAAGKIVRIQGAFQDISDRKQAELALRQKDALLDHATDAIYVQDLAAQRIASWNRGAEKLYGWTAIEAIGAQAARLLHPNDSRACDEAAQRVVAQGEWSGELLTVNKAGATLTVVARWTLLRDAQGAPQAVLVINTDITEKKKLEAQFFRAQRMESIGTLAGGIAHDLNNALSPILTAVEYLRGEVDGDEGRGVLDTLKNSAERAAELVKQVLVFARGVDGKRARFSLIPVLAQLEGMVRDTFPKDVRLEVNTSPALGHVLGDSTQLHQVLTNLCVNSRDAMPAGGSLKITSEDVLLDAAFVAMHPDARPGSWVRVRVSDTGEGMPLEVQERMFEPFFTTKPLGKGTGLGLSTTLAIVKSHDGFILFESAPGRGTTFEVYLPPDSSPAPADEPAGPKPERPRGSGEVVLVVDDEAAIRKLVKRLLERHGYQVKLASDGAEAIAEFARHRETIDLVLTDMAMPVMNGASLIRALRELNPRVRVLGSSGFAPEVGLTGAGHHFIHKPYTAETLLEAVREALAS